MEASAETLTTSRTLYIVHRQGIIGSANKIQLTLNGRSCLRLPMAISCALN